MKKKALLLLFLSILLAVNAFAQTTKSATKLSAREETDKRDVERFVAEFTSLLDEKRDLNDLPDRFFVDSYKEGVASAGSESTTGLDADIEGLTSDDRARFAIASQNFVYLSMLWYAGGDEFVYSEKEDDDEVKPEREMTDVLPRDVCDALRRSRWTAEKFELADEEAEPIENLVPADVFEAITAFEDAARLLRLALGNRDGSWKSTYNKNIAVARKKFSFYSSEECDAPFCAGLPDKTPVFYMGVFPLCVHMIRDDGKIKIYQMHISGSDD